jgi:R3H-associated N-terminal domain
MSADSFKSAPLPTATAAKRKISVGGSGAKVEAVLDAFAQLSVGVSPGPIRGTTVSLSIPLDAARKAARAEQQDSDEEDKDSRQTTPKRQIRRRDSLDRREALLKGKEGTRRRQKWENGIYTHY